VKSEPAWPNFAEDAIEHERMVVNVQLEATGEVLDHRHRAGLTVLVAVGPGGARVEGEERTDIHAEHGYSNREVDPPGELTNWTRKRVPASQAVLPP
jgi:hypothetical protein